MKTGLQTLLETLEPSISSHVGAPSPSSIKAVKSVKFGYTPTALTQELLEVFRDMVNEAIRICLHEGVKGRLKLGDRVYKEFQVRYGVVSRTPSRRSPGPSSRSTGDGTGNRSPRG